MQQSLWKNHNITFVKCFKVNNIVRGNKTSTDCSFNNNQHFRSTGVCVKWNNTTNGYI
ncbi:hypothetical protein MtrunA17_Chr2g0300571 [Medicago truncatula]|uniref:Uncharacterized protein n=1 Tax=Medicago truncatula TaxID=3880 RepID=I3SKZ7_MEDTR|nr:unknown [Medicago truncatula]RHN73628.1 hypothetical protein MtrunA17_Chr2g0300571 [Medicago truncatula]